MAGVIDGVVIAELTLSFLRHETQDAEMTVGHDRRPFGSGSEAAAASGSGRGTSSSVNRRKPTAASRPTIASGGAPHCGQASRYATAVGVNRNRQSGQQRWVMAALSVDG